MSSTDEEWEWVVPPEPQATKKYRGNNLQDAISSGSKISELRANLGLSAQDIEDYSGIRKADLLAIEAGLLEMDAETSSQLAMVLGVEINDLRNLS